LVFYLLLLAPIASPRAAERPTESWPPNAPEFRFHLVGNAHIDPVWLWPWQEGLSVVHSTFRAALDRMQTDPDFAFTASSAQFYDWVAESDPQMLAEIRKRVAEGRWAVVGGWWVEPDVNIPSGESLARHGLYSQRRFRELLGRQARVAYNPDSFGHPGTLPQILRLQDMDAYVFMRPQAHEKTLPADIFWWEGADGTRLLTYRIPYSYNAEGSLEERLRRMMAQLREPANHLMAFYGVGDHGGGATDLNIQSIRQIQKQPGAPAVLFSTPERYFEEIRKLPGLQLPVVRDDLQHHAVGCYTAEWTVKKNNRRAESLLTQGEKLASLASVIAGLEYPQAEFTSAWKKVLFQQFHDILAGSSLPEHYAVARNAHGYALEVANQALYRAAQKIAWEVPTEDPGSEYLVVFNPHAWNTILNAEYDLGWPPRDPEGRELPEGRSVLEDEQGRAVSHQWAQASTVIGRRKLVFRAPVPAFGYRQFRLRNLPGTPDRSTTLRVSERQLENEHLRVHFADDGSLTLYDKDAAQEVFAAGATGARAVVLDDPSDTWSHDVIEYSKEIGAFGKARLRVMEDGPLRGVVRVRSSYAASALEIDWLLYAGSRALEARVALDWHERHKMLKFSFPVNVAKPRPTYEIAFGHIVREANGREDPGQRWIDVSGETSKGSYGFAVINDAKYGYSVKGNDLRISMVRGAVYAHHQPYKLDPEGEYLWQDQGPQELRLLLVPHSGSWQEAGVVRLAEEFTAPVPIVYQGIHPGRRPGSASFLSVDAPNVVVSAIKKAETGDDLIVRCYETEGRPAEATLDLALLKRQWTGHFRPGEIKTLRVPRAEGVIREVNLLEE
jgi:alpha-mannosidase